MSDKNTILILKLKTRWKRWLGQKTREDKPYWTTLLNSNWSGWARNVLEKHGTFEPPEWTRGSVKTYFHTAILFADDKDLMRLDELYAQDRWMKD